MDGKQIKDVKLLDLEVADVPMYGEVGAGSVVPFTPRRGETVTVVVPEGMKKSELGTAKVCGVSLEDEGIYTGDYLIFTTRFTQRATLFDEICIVHILSTGETIAKKIIPKEDGMVALRSSGGGLKDLYYHRDDIQVQGVVVGFVRLRRNMKNLSIPF